MEVGGLTDDEVVVVGCFQSTQGTSGIVVVVLSCVSKTSQKESRRIKKRKTSENIAYSSLGKVKGEAAYAKVLVMAV